MWRVWIVAMIAACGFEISVGPVDARLEPRDGRPPDVPDPDAADAAIDAPPPGPLILEAEDFTATTSPQDHDWTPQTAIAGYSGASYMELTGGDGAPCTNPLVIAQCAASMRYDVALSAPGAYHVHLRMQAENAGENSVYVTVNDSSAFTAIQVSVPEDSTWRWTKHPFSYQLNIGNHSLYIWHREGGARVDKIAISTSETPPDP